MKRFQHCAMIIAAMAILLACAASPPKYMVFKDDPTLDIHNIKPANGKAALVVARTTRLGRDYEVETYLDTKLIGVTLGKSFFVKTDIAPGVHYVISKSENEDAIKINFEPNRIYYLQHVMRLGGWRPRVSNAPIIPKQLSKSFDSDCKLVVYNTSRPAEDMSDKDFNEAVNDYERELKEGRHQDHVSYKGVPAK
jgi:hypothetical protein